MSWVEIALFVYAAFVIGQLMGHIRDLTERVEELEESLSPPEEYDPDIDLNQIK